MAGHFVRMLTTSALRRAPRVPFAVAAAAA
jgi:hypothetical protein